MATVRTKNTKKKEKKSHGHDNSLMMNTANDDGTQVDPPKTPRDRSNKSTKKKKMSTKRPGKTGKTTADKQQQPKGKQLYHDFITETCKGVQNLLEEFDAIKTATQPIGDKPKTAFDRNPDKNRYKDVYCVDESRVILNWPPGHCDYIHANNVAISDGRHYICTQGPTEKTIEDFWRMVWQEKCKSIVMLCNVLEGPKGGLKKKCEQYWPAGVGEEIKTASGLLTVKTTAKTDFEKLISHSTILVTVGSESHEVEHFQWIDWPDRGVPIDVSVCHKLITKLKGGNLSPHVIHCSAGIGRTGTIVAMDMIYTYLIRGEEKHSLKATVTELRKSRHGSVQMPVQYVYIARVLLDYAVMRKILGDKQPRMISVFILQYDIFLIKSGFHPDPDAKNQLADLESKLAELQA